ncbi:MAG: hypothetical protein PUA49_03320 [Butyrivibrio sp.]|nr:hypothetical protein [Butyrivibrio sp.]
MKKRIITIVKLLVCGLVVFGIVCMFRENTYIPYDVIEKCFYELDTTYDEMLAVGSPEIIQNAFKEKCSEAYQERKEFIDSRNSFYNCTTEIRNIEINDFAFGRANEREKSYKEQYGININVKRESRYKVTVEYRRFYQLRGENPLYSDPTPYMNRDECYLYNGKWSPWQTETRWVTVYKVKNKWYAYFCD